MRNSKGFISPVLTPDTYTSETVWEKAWTFGMIICRLIFSAILYCKLILPLLRDLWTTLGYLVNASDAVWLKELIFFRIVLNHLKYSILQDWLSADVFDQVILSFLFQRWRLVNVNPLTLFDSKLPYFIMLVFVCSSPSMGFVLLLFLFSILCFFFFCCLPLYVSDHKLSPWFYHVYIGVIDLTPIFSLRSNHVKIVGN